MIEQDEDKKSKTFDLKHDSFKRFERYRNSNEFKNEHVFDKQNYDFNISNNIPYNKKSNKISLNVNLNLNVNINNNESSNNVALNINDYIISRAENMDILKDRVPFN